MPNRNKRALIFASILLLAGIMAAVYLSVPDWDSAPRRFEFSDQGLAAQDAKLGRTNAAVPWVVEKLGLARPVRVAIGGLGLADNDQNGQLGDLVTADLTGTPGFELVERRSLDAVLAELNLNWSGFVRAGDAMRAGKLLKVDWFLLGTETSLNGTNSLVVRVVDAHTGIMRDAGVFAEDKPPLTLARELAGFLQETRQNAAKAKIRVYLAVGAFEDESINGRLAEFPTQLRGYLTAAYRGSLVTLLEREYVATLQREVQLDLAGLTDPGTESPPAAMQSAFWLVTGSFQTYETTNFQVALTLRVQRIFGRSKQLAVQGLAGEPVEARIKMAIDGVMSNDPETAAPSRLSEARAQMYIGKDLMPPIMGSEWSGLTYGFDNWDDYEPQLAARKERKLAEAIRAFETVLLLEPTNRPAKMYAAACLQQGTIHRMDEARHYYRELIEEPVADRWSGAAEKALLQTFRDADAQAKLRWFEAASLEATNAGALAFYRQQAAEAGMEAAVARDGSPLAEQQAEQRVLKSVQAMKEALHGRKPETADLSMALDDFMFRSGMDREVAAKKLADLLPTMTQAAPELTPYLLAFVVSHQEDCRAPLVAVLQKTLADSAEHPEQLFLPSQFWRQIRNPVYEWASQNNAADLARVLLECEQRAATAGYVDFNDQEKLKLAYAYKGAKRWREAIALFESLGNKPFKAEGFGPWGSPDRPIFPDQMAAYCRERLGPTGGRVPFFFSMGQPVMCLCSPSTFLADASGLWVGIGGQLLHLNFDLKTNLVINLPMDPSIPVTALCLTATTVWIATAGEGLIAFDKASLHCRHLTEADGLLLNYLTGLHASGDSLWIGYGGATGGGLGRLNFISQKMTSYMPSVTANAGAASATTQPPPGEAVYNMITADDGELWIKAGSGLRTYDVKRDVWGSIALGGLGDWVGCFSANSEWLVEGVGIHQIEVVFESVSNQAGGTNRAVYTTNIVTHEQYSRLNFFVKTNASGEQIINRNSFDIRPIGGLAYQSLRNHQWHMLVDAEALPLVPTALAFDGASLWLGGEGYITCVDLNSGKVRKFTPIRASAVDSLQIAAGCLWAQFDWHLYRVSLSTVE